MLRYKVKDSNQKWVCTWPTRPGHYWAFGERVRNLGKPELMWVEVFECANGLARVSKGEFLTVTTTGELLWTPAFLPHIPTPDEVIQARDEFNAQQIQTV